MGLQIEVIRNPFLLYTLIESNIFVSKFDKIRRSLLEIFKAENSEFGKFSGNTSSGIQYQ